MTDLKEATKQSDNSGNKQKNDGLLPQERKSEIKNSIKKESKEEGAKKQTKYII
jgi:hypothetical protein